MEFADCGDAGDGGNREPNRRPDGPDLVTCLIADVDEVERSGASPLDRVREIALASGGEVELGPDHESDGYPPGRTLVTAVFHSAGDATHAAVGIARSVRPARMVLVTGADGRRTGQPSTRARAAALLAHVTPHQVMTVAPTAIMAGRKLPRGVELLDRGALRLGRGIPAERVYELRLGPDGEEAGDGDDVPASNLEWARRAADGFVEGFDANREVLLGAWRAAREGNPRMVLLRGECGNARTSVAADLALRVHASGGSVLHGRWDPGVGGPCQAIREALGVYADGCSGQVLRADLEGWAGEIGRLLPDVGTRIGTRLAPVPGPSPGPLEDEPVRLFEAVEAWLRAIARRRPTLLVLDDVHRADPTSLHLLDHLRHARGVLPLLTVVTVSPPDLGPGEAADAFGTLFDEPDAADLDTIDLP